MPAPVREQPRPVVEAILSDPRHHPQSNFDSAMKIRLTTAPYAGACGLDIVKRASVVYRSAFLYVLVQGIGRLVRTFHEIFSTP